MKTGMLLSPKQTQCAPCKAGRHQRGARRAASNDHGSRRCDQLVGSGRARAWARAWMQVSSWPGRASRCHWAAFAARTSCRTHRTGAARPDSSERAGGERSGGVRERDPLVEELRVEKPEQKVRLATRWWRLHHLLRAILPGPAAGRLCPAQQRHCSAAPPHAPRAATYVAPLSSSARCSVFAS